MVGCDRDLNVCTIGGDPMPTAPIDGCPWKTISVSPKPLYKWRFCQKIRKMYRHLYWACYCRIMVGCDRDMNVYAIGGEPMPPAPIDGCPWKTISISPDPDINDVFCKKNRKNVPTSTLSLLLRDNGRVWQRFECICDRGWPYATRSHRRLPLKNYFNKPPHL